MQNTRLARSLKKGCNDHITDIAIIQDKLVTSTVNQKSRKRQKTASKGQTEKEKLAYFNHMLEEEIAQDTIKIAATENRRLKKQASDKALRLKNKLLMKLEHHQLEKQQQKKQKWTEE